MLGSTSKPGLGDARVMLCGLIERKLRWSLSLRGWLLVLALSIAAATTVAFGVHPFLSVSAPVNGEFLIVEGWIPDFAIQKAAAEFRSNQYRMILVTGEPLSKGSFLAQYGTFSEVGAASLRNLGFTSNEVVSVPSAYNRRSRTLGSARSVATWFSQQKHSPRSVNIVTIGAHSRRSRLLYQRALGPQVQVGVLPIESRDYDPQRWWRYSSGLRSVIGETVAYINARLFGS